VLDILYHSLLVLLYFVLGLFLLSTAIGLPGNWFLIGVAVIVALVTGFSKMTWPWLLGAVGLAVLGEIIESLLGLVIVAHRGGTRWGVIGSIIGALAGVVLGSGVFPPLGSVIFGFVGAFGGAVAGEFIKRRDVDEAVRVGFWAFVGRAMAIASKIIVGCGILWIIWRTKWY